MFPPPSKHVSDAMSEAAEAFLEDGPAVAWLARQGLDLSTLRPLEGDVSARRYARVLGRDGVSRIVAYCPPPILDVCARFVETTRLLESVDVRTARIHAVATELGLAVLEDLGSKTVYDDAGSGATLQRFYRSAVEAIRRIGRLDREVVAACNPPLDGDTLRRELAQTWELFLSPRPVTGGERKTTELHRALDAVCTGLAADNPIPCHRDFMARNLIPLPSGELAVIDHQDLRLGPPFYDLASLFNDSLFPPSELIEPILSELVSTAHERAAYHRAVLQRSLKAIGTFVAFSRRGNDRHLPLIAPTLRRAAEQLAKLPETLDLAPALEPLWQGAALAIERSSDLLD